MKIKIKKSSEDVKLPIRGSEKAGGWDIYAQEIIHEGNNYVRVKTGLHMQPPEGYKITIVPRSNLTKHNWVLNNSSIVGDEDFRGEYEIRFRAIPIKIDKDSNMSMLRLQYEKFPYTNFERICQMYLEEVIPIEFEEVEELDNSERGQGGFGSTGLI